MSQFRNPAQTKFVCARVMNLVIRLFRVLLILFGLKALTARQLAFTAVPQIRAANYFVNLEHKQGIRH